MRVIVFHNVERDSNDRPSGMLDGYRPWHRITPVAAYDKLDNLWTDVTVINEAWEVFNIGDDPEFDEPDPRAVEYRQRGNRSLSVGDVVQVDDRFYACRNIGWNSIPKPDIVYAAGVYGTSPIEI